MKARKAYTLADVMGVVAIIGLIAGIAVPQALTMKQQADEARVRRDLSALRDAMDRMIQECGYSPTSLSDLTSSTRPSSVYNCKRRNGQAAWVSISTPSDMPWNGPYLRVMPQNPPGGTWGYASVGTATNQIIYANSSNVMLNGSTYAAYTVAH